MRLESKSYVASPADIEALTREVVEAAATGAEGRARYLNALIGTTKARLGAKRRTSAGTKTSPTERDRQLEELETVHKEFYARVDSAARETLRELGRYNALEVNRRTNFARSSMSLLRKWVKAGNDITSLVAGRTTKGMLAVEPRNGRPPSARILTNRLSRLVRQMKPVTIALYTTDQRAARAQWESLKEEMDQLLAGKRVQILRGPREHRESTI